MKLTYNSYLYNEINTNGFVGIVTNIRKMKYCSFVILSNNYFSIQCIFPNNLDTKIKNGSYIKVLGYLKLWKNCRSSKPFIISNYELHVDRCFIVHNLNKIESNSLFVNYITNSSNINLVELSWSDSYHFLVFDVAKIVKKINVDFISLLQTKFDQKFLIFDKYKNISHFRRFMDYIDIEFEHYDFLLCYVSDDDELYFTRDISDICNKNLIFFYYESLFFVNIHSYNQYIDCVKNLSFLNHNDISNCFPSSFDDLKKLGISYKISENLAYFDKAINKSNNLNYISNIDFSKLWNLLGDEDTKLIFNDLDYVNVLVKLFSMLNVNDLSIIKSLNLRTIKLLSIIFGGKYIELDLVSLRTILLTKPYVFPDVIELIYSNLTYIDLSNLIDDEVFTPKLYLKYMEDPLFFSEKLGAVKNKIIHDIFINDCIDYIFDSKFSMEIVYSILRPSSITYFDFSNYLLLINEKNFHEESCLTFVSKNTKIMLSNKYNKKTQLIFSFTENVFSFFCKSSVSICTEKNIDLYNDENHFHLNVVSIDDFSVIGNVQLYSSAEFILIRGINFTNSALEKFNPMELLFITLKFISENLSINFSKKIIVSEQNGVWSSNSNRPIIRGLLSKLTDNIEPLLLDVNFNLYVYYDFNVNISSAYPLEEIIDSFDLKYL
ncbi:OB-fold nucleic acid binding domain-containing protein [Aliivibrio fischeri]|uniref:OB-fold nucleic acid binding domain-containing protein n=1 Tax=Aliivibrio fischeri TaxID=668 RepID=UPI001F43FF3B|nr:OB-fold nucleic acid binding domain-containing protein [Aliivibrio fischeri]MCE7534918.1 OB-fold nucleic acid binding domain-containing protein [Aliivibrio fischeri]MCE7559360.1 OB-fold nucleic acid binding domain-containing protein [Aliivibrio fischeri]